jgi:hypothetical protein
MVDQGLSESTSNSWTVRSIYISTNAPFQQCSWPSASFEIDRGSVTLKARWTWLREWHVSFEEINFVLLNKNAFFVVGKDGSYGRVIGTWEIVNLLEKALISRNVKFERTGESMGFLASSKKREYLSHYMSREKRS